MKKIKIGFVPLVLLLFLVTISGCTYSSYPPRPYYGGTYGYGYGYARSPRVVVVRPAPRVVYRNPQPRYYRKAPNNARQNYESRGNGVRSNRNYRGNSSRGRSYGPR
ncbi:hypothetical protein [Salmonirosea aquatica]|uniref:Uncharacterized protein n=1 Tax=Salmonirosea aquatica TaxID=2654236 RepID=A0A7C9F6H6_9BACT|nr:hypothetical protein [Cytophagaceae bacterium SJW1-29]